MGYNGWTNYETWNCALWLDNDEGSYHWAREIVAEYEEDWQAGDALKEALEESMPELEPSMWSDLLRTAFDSIDFREVAEHYRDED